ncbi:MAG: molybdate ABC transporter substrate-binding protein [Actinomycetes bacterium]
MRDRGARRRVVLAPVVALALPLLGVVGGCGGGGAPAPAGSEPESAGGPLTVLAAASLTEAFTAIGRDFEAAQGTKVSFSFASSATLAAQITAGAPADVFAAAGPAPMRTVTDAGAAAGSPTIFASNTLQIAVPRGNPGRITGLADFADPAKTIAVCAPSAPCGAAAAEVFTAAGVRARPDTEEADVKATLAKVAANEVDAGLVYRTDVVAAAHRVEGIAFPEAAVAVNHYPIVSLAASAQPARAAAFVDYVRSPSGQAALSRAGFAAP